MKRKTKGKADNIDKHVAGRLRLRRSLMGISMQKLGEQVDLTYQQIQKYETGKNRISSGRLFQFNVALGVLPSYFYEGLYATEPFDTVIQELTGLPHIFFENKFLIKQENFEFLNAFSEIKNQELKKDIQQLLQTLSQSGY